MGLHVPWGLPTRPQRYRDLLSPVEIHSAITFTGISTFSFILIHTWVECIVIPTVEHSNYDSTKKRNDSIDIFFVIEWITEIPVSDLLYFYISRNSCYGPTLFKLI